MDEFVLWGSAGHARVLADAIGLNGGRVIAIMDNNPQARSPWSEVPLYIGEDGFSKWLHNRIGSTLYGSVAIGGQRGKDRLKIQYIFEHYGINCRPIIHPDATIQSDTTIGDGSQILARAVIAANSSIGCACIINHGANVDHDCALGDGIHLAPRATLCGCVTLGNFAFIGAGAIVLPRLSVGEDAIVGAGAVVTKDVPPGAIVIGNPARMMLRHRKMETSE